MKCKKICFLSLALGLVFGSFSFATNRYIDKNARIYETEAAGSYEFNIIGMPAGYTQKIHYTIESEGIPFNDNELMYLIKPVETKIDIPVLPYYKFDGLKTSIGEYYEYINGEYRWYGDGNKYFYDESGNLLLDEFYFCPTNFVYIEFSFSEFEITAVDYPNKTYIHGEKITFNDITLTFTQNSQTYTKTLKEMDQFIKTYDSNNYVSLEDWHGVSQNEITFDYNQRSTYDDTLTICVKIYFDGNQVFTSKRSIKVREPLTLEEFSQRFNASFGGGTVGSINDNLLFRHQENGESTFDTYLANAADYFDSLPSNVIPSFGTLTRNAGDMALVDSDGITLSTNNELILTYSNPVVWDRITLSYNFFRTIGNVVAYITINFSNGRNRVISLNSNYLSEPQIIQRDSFDGEKISSFDIYIRTAKVVDPVVPIKQTDDDVKKSAPKRSKPTSSDYVTLSNIGIFAEGETFDAVCSNLGDSNVDDISNTWTSMSKLYDLLSETEKNKLNDSDSSSSVLEFEKTKTGYIDKNDCSDKDVFLSTNDVCTSINNVYVLDNSFIYTSQGIKALLMNKKAKPVIVKSISEGELARINQLNMQISTNTMSWDSIDVYYETMNVCDAKIIINGTDYALGESSNCLTTPLHITNSGNANLNSLTIFGNPRIDELATEDNCYVILSKIVINNEGSEPTPEVTEMLAKYEYIYRKYGSLFELDNFLDRDITPDSARKNMFSVNEIDDSTWIIVAVSLLGLTAVGALIFYKKRKEY